MYVLSQDPILRKQLDSRLGINIFIVVGLVIDKINILNSELKKPD